MVIFTDDDTLDDTNFLHQLIIIFIRVNLRVSYRHHEFIDLEIESFSNFLSKMTNTLEITNLYLFSTLIISIHDSDS